MPVIHRPGSKFDGEHDERILESLWCVNIPLFEVIHTDLGVRYFSGGTSDLKADVRSGT